MKQQIKSLLLAVGLFFALSPMSYSQSQWKPRATHMQSRWAKGVKPEKPLDEYPRPQLERGNWTNLNGLWDFVITDSMTTAMPAAEDKILVPYPLESALSGVKKTLLPEQRLWYKRSVSKPKLKGGDRVLLHFGAVDYQCWIYMNGKEIGSHEGGYTAFSLDVTDVWIDGQNELVVKVYDPTDSGYGPHGKQVLNPANIYYTPSSGIWQTVWMEIVPENYISSLKMTPDIDKSVINITVNSAAQTSVKLEAGGMRITGESNTVITFPVKNPRLWSPEDPHLYDLTVTLGTDKVKSYFGMRKVEVKKADGGHDRIFLNGKPYFNLGTLDQGFWPEGLYTAPTDEALAFDIKVIKAMGFNTIRKHIKIEPARWYYHADKIGVLVWQDFVNPNQGRRKGYKDAFEQQAKETMDQLYNHPSITTWVLFNERWGAYDQQRLTEWVKTHDPSRLVNGHSGELLYVNDKLRAPSNDPFVSSDFVDYHSYPEPMEIKAIPGKASVLGEFGGVGVPVPGHQWDDLTGWGYVQVTPRELVGKYDGMVKRLKELEAQGLSGSIYTQPFDVEGEENGLLTYDREIIKIPLAKLREIHALLNPGAAAKTAALAVKGIDPDDTDTCFPEFMVEFEGGRRDSAFLRRLNLMALRKKDQNAAIKVATTYLQQLNNLFTRENLSFLDATTRRSEDAGFSIYREQGQLINNVLGNDAAERKVRKIIGEEEIDPYIKGEGADPDWEIIGRTLKVKYGALGEEKYNGARMAWAFQKKDWRNLGKFYMLYYRTATPRSEYNINNLSWTIFEQISDPEVLEAAIETQKYNIENLDITATAFDTYANLLYKAGRKQEAIEWQEKAVQMKKGALNENVFAETLEKMKRGEKTWPDSASSQQ
ncbi:sugar-binding domain-containing protein [Parapedobacter sp. DT-150]|uniref:sugar-binding domain-containing protein n=1 Tax=Parapedobacter sp. DT-150 TaxID=3396162 RepID=UPI003F19C5CC